MEHIDGAITFSRRCNYPYKKLIQNQSVRSINAKIIGNCLCLQRLVSVINFIARRGLAFKDDENVGSTRKFFKKIFVSFFQANIKKRRCDASSNWFCNSFANR